MKLGGQPVDGHPSTFFFKERNLLLTVYVDDLLLSGSITSHTRSWEELGKVIEIEDMGDLGRFLGRRHELVRVNGREGIAFNVREYMSAVEMYLKLRDRQRSSNSIPSEGINPSRRKASSRSTHVQFS